MLCCGPVPAQVLFCLMEVMDLSTARPTHCRAGARLKDCVLFGCLIRVTSGCIFEVSPWRLLGRNAAAGTRGLVLLPRRRRRQGGFPLDLLETSPIALPKNKECTTRSPIVKSISDRDLHYGGFWTAAAQRFTNQARRLAHGTFFVEARTIPWGAMCLSLG